MIQKSNKVSGPKLENTDPFNITSFIGSEIGDPTSELAEKAPRTAKHVVTVSWCWSPMHSRTSEYRIASDQNRTGWHLYEITEDENGGKKLCSRVSSGSPYKGVNADSAAYLLLKAAWESEVKQWDFDPSGFEVDKSGLLTDEDIFEISDAITLASKISWFRAQSPESLALLKELVQEPIDDQLVEVFDEIETGADELEIPQDFLALCAHYELQRPSLLSIACLVVRDASVLREKRLTRNLANVDKFRKEIDLLVSELSDTKRRGGGMELPSIRTNTKNFLERYVGEHGALPVGRHVTNGFMRASCDFDELRMKHSI
jgi:hypothetical protein